MDPVGFYFTLAFRYSSPFAKFIDISSLLFVGCFLQACAISLSRSQHLLFCLQWLRWLEHLLTLAPYHSHSLTHTHTRTKNNLQFYLVARSCHAIFVCIPWINIQFVWFFIAILKQFWPFCIRSPLHFLVLAWHTHSHTHHTFEASEMARHEKLLYLLTFGSDPFFWNFYLQRYLADKTSQKLSTLPRGFILKFIFCYTHPLLRFFDG